MSTPPPPGAIAPPEPALTSTELVARARALRPTLIELQSETEERGYYSAAMHEQFLAAGFYRMLIPRRFGGYQVDIPTFMRVVIELARGCASSAWCLCLASGHALQVGAWFSEHAQAEIFGSGDFRCPAVAAPTGSAKRTDDGWEISGTWSYSSGAPYATHTMGQTWIEGEPGPEGLPGRILLFVAPRSEWTMLDDWGDLLGLKGSGSHSIRLDQARIPAHFALEDVFMVAYDVSESTPGARLHRSAIYGGGPLSFFQGELGALAIGMARGALDEYERFLTTRMTQRPPVRLRAHDPDYQRWYGQAIGRIATAEAALLGASEEWMELAQGTLDGHASFTHDDELRLNLVSREAMGIAWDAVQGIIFRTAGSSAARDGERLQRIFRDLAMDWGHFGSIVGDSVARELGALRLGIPVA